MLKIPKGLSTGIPGRYLGCSGLTSWLRGRSTVVTTPCLAASRPRRGSTIPRAFLPDAAHLQYGLSPEWQLQVLRAFGTEASIAR